MRVTGSVDVPREVDALRPAWVRDALGGATGKGIRVAVVDSGWDRSLDDPRVLPGVGFVDPADDFGMARNDDDADVLGHGTACADLILRIAPDARVVPVKVFGKVLETSPGTLHAALLWALEAGVQVINVSLGTRLKPTLHLLYTACEIARQAGIVVVAAGHNANRWSYPAIFENVIGVSAARFESPYHFRYRPEHAMEVEAWGVEQPVLWVGGDRVVKHGTSFAAPNIAGIVALILEHHPGATLEQVRAMLADFALSVDTSVDDEDDEDWDDHGPVAAPPGKGRDDAPEEAPRKASRRRTTSKTPGSAPAAPSEDTPKKAPRKRAAGSRRATTSEADAASPDEPVSGTPEKAPRTRATASRGARTSEAAATPPEERTDDTPKKAPRKKPARSRGG